MKTARATAAPPRHSRMRTRRAVPAICIALLAPLSVWSQVLDMSNDTITCNTVVASATISPPLVIHGTATATTMRVRGSLAGCTVTGSQPASIVSGRLTGKITGTSNECVTLFQPLAGTITMRWKADRATPIAPKSSTLAVSNVTFGGFTAPWGATYGQFSLGTTGVTGAFTGGDAGAASSNVSVTGEDIEEILARCGSPRGLDTLHIGIGSITLR